MAELKTKLTDASVTNFLENIADENKCRDCKEICKMMEELIGQPAKMWGTAIVGIGDYRYSYSTGQGGDWFLLGFSPRKANISLYIMGCDLSKEKYQEILSRLGKHKTGKSCIYINRLTDINKDVLKELCETSVKNLMTKSTTN